MKFCNIANFDKAMESAAVFPAVKIDNARAAAIALGTISARDFSVLNKRERWTSRLYACLPACLQYCAQKFFPSKRLPH